MRKGLFFLFVGALVFAFSPIAMAGVNNNVTYDIEESGHTDYGATQWHNTWIGSLGNAGDESWGYVTGMDPFAQGLMSDGSGTGLTAPLYTDPCPADIIGTGYDSDSPGGCPTHTNDDYNDPQTAPAATATDIVFLDDMLTKMFQADPNDADTLEELLNQQVDILIYQNGVGASATNQFIDSFIDQDLVYFDGDSSSYLGSGFEGDGIKGRLTTIFQKLDPAVGATVESFDQWMVSYMKDTGELWDTGRVVSSLSTWQQWGERTSCPVCSYTYPAGHDPVVKTVPEIDAHP
jgi:hypothetical protein